MLKKISCALLKGVGPKVVERLRKLDIRCVQDLLFHLPLRYEDRTHITPIRYARFGQHLLIEGNIVSSEVIYRGRRSLMCSIEDGTGILTLRFFYFNHVQQKSMTVGSRLRCFGEIRWGAYTRYEMIHPEYRLIDIQHPPLLSGKLTPVYPTTEGLNQIMLRKIILQALLYQDAQQDDLEELVPLEVLTQYRFPSLKEAVSFLHQPPQEAQISLVLAGQHPCQQRLAFEELLAHHLSLRLLRKNAQQQKAIALLNHHQLRERFLRRLPFQLTNAQKKVDTEIQQDLQKPYPMLRLMQGDVGSGKTVVALLAALTAIENGCQVAIMAPTELLAEQHLRVFRQWCDPLDIQVAWLSGQSQGKVRQRTLEEIASGRAQIIIGTHALFQADVHFHQLVLVIIDEQHRFGVHQRLLLKEKGCAAQISPHQLIMTATPIPRTLAMVAYAELDHSTIDELPLGRKPVHTAVMSCERRIALIDRIRSFCKDRKQVYWVCTLIEESEVLQCQAANSTAEKLAQDLPDLKIGLIHGRLKSKDKEAVMCDFLAGQYDILVATTVIEVGVDVPNASLIVIENAERLGLSQLHQLRGRVGRSQEQSHCMLLYKNPLSTLAKQRLQVMRQSCDGFEIARRDLELRGPGEILSTRQSGLCEMKIASLLRDQALFPAVQQAATLIMQKYPEKILPLIRRWVDFEGRYGEVL